MDLRNYLERIYNVPVAAVRTRVQHGGCPGRGLPSLVWAPARVAGLVPPRGHSATWSFAHEETEGGPQGGGGLPALELGWPGPAGCSEQGPTLNPPTRSPACPWVGQQSTVLFPWAFLVPSC